MIEQNNEDNKVLLPQSPEKRAGGELDAAGKSLSDALRISFVILKIIMIVLVGLFLLSGFETVGSDEQGLVLRFGKIRGVGEERLLGPGLHWIFPYPIEEIVKIPVEKRVNLAINSFWYYQRKEEIISQRKRRTRPDEPLNPVRDGYCITRSEEQNEVVTGSDGSDYNIVHSKWQLIYRINDPERFFKNVSVEDVKPGQVYFDVITGSVMPLLENLVEDAVVTVMVNYTIDEARSSDERIARDVKGLVQEKLNEIQSGIMVESMLLTDMVWPRQVDEAFLASLKASQSSQQAVSEAITYAEKTLNETAGPVAEKLFAALYDETISEEEKKLLWDQLAGAAQEKIAQAKAYRTRVADTTEASAEYLKKILPQYRKHPELVIQDIYLDAVEYVLSNADEKFIIQPAEGTRGREIRVLVNRDPTIKPKSEKSNEEQ